MKTVKKILRYIALAAFVLGVFMVSYGLLVNQTAFATFKALLNQKGFKSVAFGAVLIIAAIMVFILSFTLGRKKVVEVEKEPEPKEETPQE